MIIDIRRQKEGIYPKWRLGEGLGFGIVMLRW
jgi:hypothetical protein